jgi:hypothetical protein
MQKIDTLPLWVFFTIVFVVSLIWIGCGFQIGEVLRTNHVLASASRGVILPAVLSLLSFMLGFTFNIAANKFDARKGAVLGEANALHKTYLCADFFNESLQIQIKKLLREYVKLRAHPGLPAAQLASAITRSESIQDELWTIAADVAKDHDSSMLCSLFLSSLSDVVNMHSTRIAVGLHSRVPLPVWAVLFAVSALSMIGVGLDVSRNWAEIFIWITAFSTVMVLIADLDRPVQGLIRHGQKPMIELSEKLGPP